MEHYGQITTASRDEYNPISGWCYACHRDKCNPCLEGPKYNDTKSKTFLDGDGI